MPKQLSRRVALTFAIAVGLILGYFYDRVVQAKAETRAREVFCEQALRHRVLNWCDAGDYLTRRK